MAFTIGVISDTHGLLRPEAVKILEGSSAIIHAGDVGSKEVLLALKEIAPTHAVRGNVDHGLWAETMPVTDIAFIGERYFYIVHNPDSIDIDPVAAGVHAVISGHTHIPELYKKKNVLYMNPGSAGPRRFTRPVSMGMIIIDDNGIYPDLIKLE
jgi:putative phosphoesterase